MKLLTLMCREAPGGEGGGGGGGRQGGIIGGTAQPQEIAPINQK